MHRSLSSAYSKRNCLWPVGNSGSGWERGQLLERFEAAVRHLAMTPRRTLVCDPNYGSDLYLLRTQSEASDALLRAYQSQLGEGFAVYIPELQLFDVTMEPEGSDEETKNVIIAWGIVGAEEGRHGELAGVKKTSVPIV
jgi:phage baseplate assembly protein W